MIVRLSVVCSLMLLTAAVLRGQDDKEWKEFSVKESGFTVLIPSGSLTTHSSDSNQTKDGTFENVTYSVEMEMGKKGYGVGCQTYPAKLLKGKSVEQILDYARTGGLERIKGRLMSEKKIKLDKKYSGRELLVAGPAGMTIRFRMYWANQRIYMMMAMGSDAFVDSPDAEKFLSSLKVTPIPK